MAKAAGERLRVPVGKLRRACRPSEFKFKTTADIKPLEGTVGQDRAVNALDFGLSIEADGFNVFVSGETGTGRSTELRTQIERIARTRPAARDWCYVFNFDEPAEPQAISLPPGRAMSLARSVEGMVGAVRAEVPRALESDEYARRRDAISREAQSGRERIFEMLQQEAEARSLALNATPMGISTVPTVEGKPITKEQYEALTDEQRHDIQRRTSEVDAIVAQMAPQLRRLDRDAMRLVTELDRHVIESISQPLAEELEKEFAGEEEACRYIERLGRDIAGNIDMFRAPDEQAQQPAPGLPAMLAAPAPDGVWNRYRVNVIVSGDAAQHAPMVFEEHPTYYNLFGRVDYRSSFGSMVTDHMMIKPGSLHRANGGFLVLQALDAISQPLVWETLKRSLRTRQVRMQNVGEHLSILPTSTLAPEPIPLDVKVAMIGSARIFHLLEGVDEDFRKLFKARADFTTDVERTAEHIGNYARFVARQVELLGMRPFEAAAVARVVEHSSRMVSDQTKLSLNMMQIVDLLVEADYWACDRDSKTVAAKDVEGAIEKKVYRSSLVEDRLQEFIAKNVIKVDVDGMVVGQVNGLSVFDTGDYAFGRPSRITARVSLGRGQVVNIEREVQRSGPSHSKGFLILNGYINGKFAHRQPLSFAASIAFEQVYNEVDGDSASSTELYALLSAITDVPLKQGIAVTGSVNQLGEIQAIGGVNEKIEGFYAVCKARGLTGDQGVMIPRDNLRNLMLKPEVVQAVERGVFHIWAVSTIEEGIELLTGMPAGKLRKDETYPEGTVFRKVTDALDAMTRRGIEVNRAAQRELVAASPVGEEKAGSPNGKPRAPRKPDPPRIRASGRRGGPGTGRDRADA